MNEQQIHSKITLLEIDVLKAVKQRTLEKFTEGPSVERTRLFFLLLPFFNKKNWSGEIEASAKTVSIVYAALHAHDNVIEDSLATKKQQLTVLAGDFYSGIYYQMLANLENVTLIQRLAKAVIRISEQKASLFEERVLSLDEVGKTIEIIETELLSTFYKFYGFEEYLPISSLMLSYIRYAEELECLQQDGQTRVLRMVNRSLNRPEEIEFELLAKMDDLHEQITQTIHTYSFDYDLKNFMLHQITPHQHRAEQLTREG